MAVPQDEIAECGLIREGYLVGRLIREVRLYLEITSSCEKLHEHFFSIKSVLFKYQTLKQVKLYILI